MLSGMTSIQSLLTVSSVYAAAEKVSLKTVSSRLFDDAKRLDQIVNGADITVGRLGRALVWFSANWPAEAEWPASVVRPFTSPEIKVTGQRKSRTASV
jgi:hypothetical protein